MVSAKDAPRAAPPLDMESIDRAMTFTPSERCTVSCGTVCVDPRASRVLILFNRRLGIWQLPKGRKNIGEDLHAAALRETYEETGVHAHLLPLKIHTRSTHPSATPATPAAPAALAALAAPASDPKVTRDVFNNELVGVVQYPDLQASTPGTTKIVFFFAARADSTTPMGAGAQEDDEDLQAEWVDFQVASQRLRFGPEKEAMWKVKRDMTRSGIAC